MDSKSYSFNKEKILLTLSGIIKDIFSDHCKEFLHVVATIGVTPDSEVCGSVMFNFEETILKHNKKKSPSPENCTPNATPTLVASTGSCHLPVLPAVQNEAVQHPDNENQCSCTPLPALIENCADLSGRIKGEPVVGTLTVEEDHTDGNTMAPYVIVPENLNTTDHTLPTVDSESESFTPELDQSCSSNPPELEKQVFGTNADIDTNEENDTSVFVLSPNTSADSVIVFDLSHRCPPVLNKEYSTTSDDFCASTSSSTNITNSRTGSPLVEYLRLKDTSSNVGDTQASVWCTKRTMTLGVKKWKHREFTQLLKNSPTLNLECCPPTQPSGSSFFLALAQQLAKLHGHPKQGISHSELRQQVVQYMEKMEESRVQLLSQYIQGGRSAWRQYREIIGTESSLVDHLAVFLTSECLDIAIRVISMVTKNMKLTLRETVLNGNSNRCTVVLGEYFPHYYQTLQVKRCSQQLRLFGKTPRVTLRKLTKTQLRQNQRRGTLKELRPQSLRRSNTHFSKPQQWGLSGIRMRRTACGKCGPCKIKVDCKKCKNCLNKAKAKNKCKLRKCIRLMK